MDLKGKIALVTGAAAGIGRAYCEELLRHGAKVSICDLNSEVGEKLAEQLCTKYGQGKALFCQCDVTDYPQFEESFQKTISAFGGLDIVINNAGIFNDRFWELEVDVNLNGVIRGTLLAQRFLGKDRGGRGGTVVTTASTLGLQPCACVPIYTATKHAIIGFTRSLGDYKQLKVLYELLLNDRTFSLVCLMQTDLPFALVQEQWGYLLHNLCIKQTKDPFHMSLSGVRMMALCPGATRTESNADDIKKGLLSPDYEAAYHRDYDNRIHQPVEAVAKALIHILLKGSSGSVWVVENQQPPKEVKFPVSF